MITSEEFIALFKRTYWVIQKQTEGLSHEDSLLQLPFEGNCLNWVLGHILVYRDRMVTRLGAEPSLSEAETELYARGSEPLHQGGNAVQLEKLLNHFARTQDQIIQFMQTAQPETLAAYTDQEQVRTLADRIAFIHWHETYHTGQLEIFRQLAGKDDRVIP